MQLKDIKIGEVYLLDDFDTVEQGELVEIIKVYDDRTPYQDILIRELNTQKEFRSSSTSLVELEKAEQILYLTLKQVEKLYQEVKKELYKQNTLGN
jgi:hypothetical protein